MLTNLYNRGVEDILIACVDGLTGFPEAIATIYPEAEVQQCIIHQMRNALKYVASKHQKELMADLKPVSVYSYSYSYSYRTVSKETAEMELDRLESKWGNISQSCFALGVTNGQIYRFTSSIQNMFEKPSTLQMR